MRLATIKLNNKEVAGIVTGKGILPVAELNRQTGSSWKEDMMSLIQVQEIPEMTKWYNEGGKEEIEKLDGIVPKAEVVYAPLYRNPKRIFGIGLNYARHLAQLHKGDLAVRPNDPIGSVFTFTFPFRREAYVTETVWQEEDGAAPEENTAVPAEPATGASILVVEDNPDMREYIRGFLSEECKVTLAGDGEEAWKLIRISAPDLVISDVMMPYKDGYTLCKELKNDPEYCHIPVILLTAKADMENQIHGLDLGADGYVRKPFDPAYLTALVRNLLATRRRLQGMLADRTSTSTDENPAPEEGLQVIIGLHRINLRIISEVKIGHKAYKSGVSPASSEFCRRYRRNSMTDEFAKVQEDVCGRIKQSAAEAVVAVYAE